MVREEENATVERRVITERVPPWVARAADPRPETRFSLFKKEKRGAAAKAC